MQGAGHDPNLALHASTALPGHVLDVVVLTADAGLLAILRDASAAEHAIWHAPTADAAVDLLIGGRCGVLIADLGALSSDAAAFFDRLHAQFPELVLMAAGRRDEEGAVAALITKGVIYRLLHKPVSPARAGLFITAATRRYHELRNAEPVAMATIKTAAARPHWWKLAAAAAALLVLAVVLALFLLGDADEPVPPPVGETAIPAPTAAEQIATLIGRAHIAYARDQLSEPRGDNALEHYRAVLALDPGHAEAQRGVARVVEALEARVIAALAARNASQGLTALAALQSAQSDHPRLETLRAELISVSRSVGAAAAPSVGSPAPARTQPGATAPAQDSVPATEAPSDAPPADAPAPAQAEVVAATEPDAADVEALVQLREQGALIAPPGANAYDALAPLRAAFPDADVVRAEEQRLAFALLERARTALAGQDLENAVVYLQRAESLVPGMTATRSLQDQLALAQQERAFAANVVQAAALKRTREVAPVYPREAERLGAEGWVDVEFTIARDGSTRDLVVRNAQRGDLFEKPALDSVRRWRFEPVMRNGAPAEQRAVLRVRFALE